jgi:hypothetical protein
MGSVSAGFGAVVAPSTSRESLDAAAGSEDRVEAGSGWRARVDDDGVGVTEPSATESSAIAARSSPDPSGSVALGLIPISGAAIPSR